MTDSDELDMKYPCLHLDGGEVWEHVFLIGSNVYIEDISLKGAPHPPESLFILSCGDPPLIALC